MAASRWPTPPAGATVPRAPGVDPLGPTDPGAIGRYRLRGRIGAGGMGTVYLADAPGGRQVALKVIRPELAGDPTYRARFAREVAAARRVAGFCTAQVLDADAEGNPPYLVTEYVEGVSLDRAVAERGPLDPSTLSGVAVGVAAALTAIHAAGLVHRDLKPANVLLSWSGPRVIDFGIARDMDVRTALTGAGLTVGSPGWMAPEQLQGGDVTAATDVFAWGCLVAYAALGHHPYGDGDMFTVAHRVLSGAPDLRGLPASLGPLVSAALSYDPAHRPGTRHLLLAQVGADGATDPARAVTRAIDRVWPGAPVPVPPPAAPPPVRPTRYDPSPPGYAAGRYAPRAQPAPVPLRWRYDPDLDPRRDPEVGNRPYQEPAPRAARSRRDAEPAPRRRRRWRFRPFRLLRWAILIFLVVTVYLVATNAGANADLNAWLHHHHVPTWISVPYRH